MVSAELGGSWKLSAPLKTEYNPISKLYKKKAAVIFLAQNVSVFRHLNIYSVKERGNLLGM